MALLYNNNNNNNNKQEYQHAELTKTVAEARATTTEAS